MRYPQQIYNTLQLLYTDEQLKSMLMSFPDRYVSAMPTIEQVGALSGMGLSILFAVFTAGTGAAATVASKTTLFVKAADKIEDIVVLLKKVKITKKQNKLHNNKIAATTDKPKNDRLDEKD